jgi:hypothetical protein
MASPSCFPQSEIDDRARTMKKTPDQIPVSPCRIALKMQPAAIGRFFPLLGEGFVIRGRAGLSVEDFLCQEAGIPADYLRERVQTVFLGGKAIDELGAAAVGDGSVLALSAAMPGLAGAVLRRGGFYAAMRRQISYAADTQTLAGETAGVTLKLFNLVARELGPEFLKRGVLIACRQLKDFLERQGHWGLKGCVAAEMDSKPVKTEDLSNRISLDGQAVLTVKPAPA